MARVLKTALLTALLASLLLARGTARGQEPGVTPSAANDERLAIILARVGQSVERYHRGVFSISFTETFKSEELKQDMSPKKSKEFVYESVILRKSLSDEDGDYFAETLRRIKAVDRKPVKKGKSDERPFVSTHGALLNFLLPKLQKLYQFSLEGEETLRGRKALRVSMLRPGDGEPRVEWKGRSFRARAPMRITVWMDAENGDVLQVESRLAEAFEFDSPRAFSAGPFGRFGPSRHLKYVREDYTVRFRPVLFKDPEQTLLLPEYAEWITVIEGARRPRLRTTLSFTNYRRFVSDVKVIE